MRRERTAQVSLVNGLVALGLGTNPRCGRIEPLLDWPALESELAGVYARTDRATVLARRAAAAGAAPAGLVRAFGSGGRGGGP